MNVAFYLTGSDPHAFVFADHLMRSVRSTMPDVRITQLTDAKTDAVYGVDDVRRKPTQTLSLLRSAHYAELIGEWILLDTDCIIERDVRHVFDASFDVAVTDRDWSHISPLPDAFVEKMPYCAGVVFSREARFWRAVHERVALMNEKDQKWYGDQVAMAEVIRRNEFQCRVLPGSVYQYPPQTEQDDLSHVGITHYKGPERKQLLLKRIQRECFV